MECFVFIYHTSSSSGILQVVLAREMIAKGWSGGGPPSRAEGTHRPGTAGSG